MKTRNIAVLLLFLLSLSLQGCKDLTELNENPNGTDKSDVNPNLVLPTVLTEGAKIYLDLGYQTVAGVMQHTQKDAWYDAHNDYAWSGSGSQNWSGCYAVLRNNQVLINRAEALNLDFHHGVALTMRAFMFGLIADVWGDAPYTAALQAEQGGSEYLLPRYDSQETIYRGVIQDLERANELFSKDPSEYASILAAADVYFNGDPMLWRQFANSLLLRYHMRLSEKLPSESRTAVEHIYANPQQYPLIRNSAHDAAMTFPGTNESDSWPTNTVNDASGSNYRRLKMCATLVEYMQDRKDPRLPIWAKKVEIPLVVRADFPPGTDEIVDGKRHLSPDKVASTNINTDPDYVGLPPSVSALPSGYNMNPTPGQTSFNPHVSYLHERYSLPKDPLLKARLLSAAEVHFILAEAALKGWDVGDTKTHYEQAIKSSLETWGVAETYGSYIAQPQVAFNNSLEQLIEQKWVASWTAATESWLDYRRTGYPALKAGPVAIRPVIPVRFLYMQDELNINSKNVGEAMERLELTSYSRSDGKNSPWSKPWLLQGTSKPW